MASISNDPNGRRRILFIGANQKRRVIRLGKVSQRFAESVKVKVEDLVSASITGHAPADETARWLAHLDPDLYNKLARVELVKRRCSPTLAAFTESYIHKRVDIKPRTQINLNQARQYLLGFFDANRPLRDITPGDAEEFRLHLVGQGKSDNTVHRAVGRARQFFRAAMQYGLIESNPFEGIAASVRANPQRFYFVSRDITQEVLDHCPDSQWRLIVALTRYGGLRCPSEVLALSWSDVNWELNRIRVPSPKTEHLEGKASRTIPLFPELRPLLMEAFELAQPGTQHVIYRYRDGNANLRTQLQRIIRRAGLDPWPKLFQNMRSTRETELAETFPMHVVCQWIGNSQPVAVAHYLQLTDEHFERAVRGNHRSGSGKVAQKAAQKLHETTRNKLKTQSIEYTEGTVTSEDIIKFPVISGCHEDGRIPPRGVEPLFPD